MDRPDILLREGDYLFLAWFFNVPECMCGEGEVGGDVIGSVIRPAGWPPNKWLATYRHRYYRDARVWDGEDRKNWREGIMHPLTEQEVIEKTTNLMEQMILGTAIMFGVQVTPELFYVRGDGHKLNAMVAAGELPRLDAWEGIARVKVDVMIRPADWLLGIWWAEFGRGESALMPKGGQWLFLVRDLPVKNVRPRTWWVREEAIRKVDATDWQKFPPTFSSCPPREQAGFARERQQWMVDHTNARTGGVTIDGRGALLREMFESGLLLPAWMSIAIFEPLADAPASRAT